MKDKQELKIKKEKLKCVSAFMCCFLIFNFSFLIGYSQDMHFSQFTQAPLQVNPAQAGTTAWIRGIIIYRNQWSNVVPYNSFGFSFDQKIKKRWKQISPKTRTLLFKSVTEKGLGWGVGVYNDRAGDGHMNTLQGNLSVAYQVQISKESMLSGGLQAGIVQRSITYSGLTWENQYSPGSATGFDPSANPVENFSNSSIIYPDLSCGLFYAYRKNERYMRGNDQRDIVLGASVMHLNRPAYSFFGNNERLSLRYMLHGSGIIGISNTNFALVPGVMYAKQTPNTEFLFGTLVRYMLKEDSKYTGYVKGAAFSLGGYYRYKDAAVIAAVMEFSAYQIGLSYDINVSDFKAASQGMGGFEITLRFLNPAPFLFTKASFNN